MQTAARLVALVVGLLTAPPFSSADEAWRTDGQRLHGTLTLDGGQLHFKPTDGGDLTLAAIKRFRFTDKPLSPFRVGAGRRVLLRDGQRISGQIRNLSKETLSLRTAWAARLELPRTAVVAIDSLPGWRTVVDEDFHQGLKAFTTAGEPTLTEPQADTGARAVLLRAAQQKLKYTLTQPLPAGRVGINFEEQGPADGARWAL